MSSTFQQKKHYRSFLDKPVLIHRKITAYEKIKSIQKQKMTHLYFLITQYSAVTQLIISLYLLIHQSNVSFFPYSVPPKQFATNAFYLLINNIYRLLNLWSIFLISTSNSLIELSLLITPAIISFKYRYSAILIAF